MEFGIVLPNLGGTARPREFCRLAQQVEELGYNSLWVSDHVVIPNEVSSRYPYSSSGALGIGPEEDILEPLTTLSFLAGATSKIRLGISVQILPYRPPLLNAKMLTTLDVLSGGRTIVGVGVGWMEEEFKALDADFPNRGRVTDEHIQVFKALCTQDEPEYEGEHYKIRGFKFYPRPVQSPHPPIWVGGNSPPALRRAATLGDGWHAVRMRPADLAETCRKLEKMRRDAGTDKKPFDVSLRSTLEVSDSPLPEGRTPMTGSAFQIVDDIRSYEASGLHHLVLGPRTRGLEETAAMAQRFAGEVLPLLG
jgi:probable F420-dependent oxidoreductase